MSAASAHTVHSELAGALEVADDWIVPFTVEAGTEDLDGVVVYYVDWCHFCINMMTSLRERATPPAWVSDTHKLQFVNCTQPRVPPKVIVPSYPAVLYQHAWQANRDIFSAVYARSNAPT
jgi:hypothetical protein